MQEKTRNTWWSATSGILNWPCCRYEIDWRMQASRYGLIKKTCVRLSVSLLLSFCLYALAAKGNFQGDKAFISLPLLILTHRVGGTRGLKRWLPTFPPVLFFSLSLPFHFSFSLNQAETLLLKLQSLEKYRDILRLTDVRYQKFWVWDFGLNFQRP